jgi:hypothetical protein
MTPTKKTTTTKKDDKKKVVDDGLPTNPPITKETADR